MDQCFSEFSNIGSDDSVGDGTLDAFRDCFGINSEEEKILRNSSDPKSQIKAFMRDPERRLKVLKWSQDPRTPRPMQDAVIEGDTEVQEITSDHISDLHNQLSDAIRRVSKLEADNQLYANLADRIERNLDYLSSCAEIGTHLYNHLNTVNLLVSGATAISPLLAYRSIYKTWAEHHLLKYTSDDSMEKQTYAQTKNRFINREFNKRVVPAIFFSYGMNFLIKSYFPFFNFPKPSSSAGSASLIFFSKLLVKETKSGMMVKLIGGIKTFSFYIFVVGMPWLIVNVLPHYLPILKEKYIWLCALILVWLWMFFWFILDCVELYVILLFALDPNYINIPDSYPKFIREWLKDLRLASQFKSEGEILRVRTVRLLLFMLYMSFFAIVTGIFIYWYLYL